MDQIGRSFARMITPLVLAGLFTGPAVAQSGQPIYPSYDGYALNEDGTYTLMFGYYSHNSDTVTIVPGPDNTFLSSTSGDRGQPTIFFPGRHRFTCRMVLDGDFDGTPQWTVAWAGHRDTTTARVLLPYYTLDLGLASIAREGLDTQNAPRGVCINAAPTVDGGGSDLWDRNAALSRDLLIDAEVADDGLPRGGALTAMWKQVSGLGIATFQNPNQGPTFVSFSAPGEFNLELSVTDSESTTVLTVNVNVSDREEPRVWPTVEIPLQRHSDYFEEGEAFVLVAEATAYRGASVRGVDFLVDGSIVGSATAAPYRAEWTPTGIGPHTLQARVTDTEGRAGESTPVEVYVGGPGWRGVARHISRSEDDAEEIGNGSVLLEDNDLDLGLGRPVGLRFTDLPVPRGAEIRRAYIQFSAEERRNTPVTELRIRAEASGNAAPFAELEGNLSARARSSASVQWSPPPWYGISWRTEGQQTPDLSALVEEVVARADWQEGNALVFFIGRTGGRGGRARRSAYSYDRSPARAPVLYLEYGEVRER